MSNTTENITLTPAEKEMIENKRKQQELAAQQKQLERQADMEKKIIAKQDEMSKDLIKSERLAGELKIMFEQLHEKDYYELIKNDEIKQYECYHYADESEGTISTRDDGKIIYFEQSQSVPSSFITFKGNHGFVAKITAHDYSVDRSTGRSFRSRMEYQGVRFKLDMTNVYDRKNDHLRSAKTIHEKVCHAYQAVIAKKKDEQHKTTGITWLKHEVRQLHPNASKIEQVMLGSGYSGPGRIWRDGHPGIEVQFNSGLRLRYSFGEKDGKMFSNIFGVDQGYLSNKDKQSIENFILEQFAK